MKMTFFGTLGNCKNAPRRSIRTKRGGSRPLYLFRFFNNSTFERRATPSLRVVPDVGEVAFSADLNALANQARKSLTGLEAEFVLLAVAVYLADRCAPRYPYGKFGPAHWRRRIHIELPVCNPVVWIRAEATLTRTLEFLTEDDWTFKFVPGRTSCTAEQQGHFPKLRGPEVAWTSLFSGGLDSLAGALHRLAQPPGVGLLVSGQTHNRIAVGQNAQVAELRELFPGRVEHVGVCYGFPDKNRHDLDGFESTQRTRAFIHLSLGSVAALKAGNSKLYLFENGFGALNLPCDSAQFGSQNSRGTHPIFLLRMEELVRTVFSQPFVIANPFIFSTKGQMLSATSVRRFGPLLQKSFSCDHFPNYNHSKSQCGCCPSCVIRRLSFHAAGLLDGAKNYSKDLFHHVRPLSEAEFLSLSKLTAQAVSIAACLHSREPWPALYAKWPDLLRTEIEIGASSSNFRHGVINLLNRHVAEWSAFSSAIHPDLMSLAA